MQQDNPYSALLGTLRLDADERKCAAWRLGIVVTVAPLVIRTGSLDLSGSDLLVNYQIRTNTEAVSLSKIAGELTAAVDCTTGAIKKITASDGTLAAMGLFGGVLVPGDQVVMLQSDDQQQFVVLCKVVSA